MPDQARKLSEIMKEMSETLLRNPGGVPSSEAAHVTLGGHKPLPAPNVVVARAGTPPDQLSPEAVKGILVNLFYTGVGPFPRLVEDEAWVRACARLIEEEGAQQFLVNLLYVLRECFQEDSTA